MSSNARRNTCNTRNTLVAVPFLAALIGGALFVLTGALPPQNVSPAADTVFAEPGQVWQAMCEQTEMLTRSAEASVNDLLDRKHGFIELYGAAQKFLGRSFLEDAVEPKYSIARLSRDMITFAYPRPEQVDMTIRAEEMSAFARRVQEELAVPTLYVQAPSKTDVAALPVGLTDPTAAEADQFLSLLEQDGVVDTLDLRPAFRDAAAQDRNAAETLFFHTDHHWTPAGAFLGYQVLCGRLQEQYDFVIPPEYLDAQSFHVQCLENIFLGSQGKRVGSYYAGVDDFELWTPKFDTSFTYSASGEIRKGPFAVSLLYPERLTETGGTGWYDTNPYAIYSGGDHALAQAVNERCPDGKRVVVLRDSFGCTLTPFLSLITAETDALDPRSFGGGQEELMDCLRQLQPDLLLVLNTTGSLRVDSLYGYLTACAPA